MSTVFLSTGLSLWAISYHVLIIKNEPVGTWVNAKSSFLASQDALEVMGVTESLTD